MAGSYAIPPRPKPGRKPATDEPQTKRKAQNREAQRNFRQRKAQKLNDLELEVSIKERHHLEEKNALHARIEVLDNQNQYQQQEINGLLERTRSLEAQLKEQIELSQRLQTDCDFWKTKAESAPQPSSSSARKGAAVSSPAASSRDRADSTRSNRIAPDGCGNCEVDGDCACVQSLLNTSSTEYAVQQSHGKEPVTPISDDVQMSDALETSYDDREIDFTTHQPTVEIDLHHDKRTSVAFVTHPAPVEDRCGFCTDVSNCLCAATAASQAPAVSEKDVLSLPPMAAVPLKRTARKATTSGPGSCADCRANPLQREWCRAVAMGKLDGSAGFTGRTLPSVNKLSSIDNNTANSARPRLPSIDMAGRFSVGCSDAFRLFDGRVSMDRNKMDWTKELVPLPRGAARHVELPSISGRVKAEKQGEGWSPYEIDSASILGALAHHDRRHAAVRRTDAELTEARRLLQTPKKLSKKADDTPHQCSGGCSGSLGRILN